MTLSIIHTIKDKDENPLQWHFSIKEIDEKDTAVIASKFGENYHVAIYGFDSKENFEFKGDSSKSLENQLKTELLKRPMILRRIIKVGIFNDI